MVFTFENNDNNWSDNNNDAANHQRSIQKKTKVQAVIIIQDGVRKALISTFNQIINEYHPTSGSKTLSIRVLFTDEAT